MARSAATALWIVGAALVSVACVVVLRDSEPSHGRLETDVEMARRAMAEVRTIGTAFESFAVDSNHYPVLTGDSPDFTVDRYQLDSAKFLATCHP
jgi:hypothetical protein